MACTFKWYNLPTKIKEETGLVVKWRSLPTQLNTIYKALEIEKPTCASTITYEEFKWFSLPHKIEIICDLLDCVETVLTAFSISSFADGENGYISYSCPPTNPQPIDSTAYHNGVDEYPTVGDTIFEDINGAILHRDGTFLHNNGSVIIENGVSVIMPPLGCE